MRTSIRTIHSCCHGNVVDFTRYRQLLQGDSFCSAPPPPRRTRRRSRAAGLFWDTCASVGILVMTLTVTIRVLML